MLGSPLCILTIKTTFKHPLFLRRFIIVKFPLAEGRASIGVFLANSGGGEPQHLLKFALRGPVLLLLGRNFDSSVGKSVSSNSSEIDGLVGSGAGERSPGVGAGPWHELNFITSYKIYIITDTTTWNQNNSTPLQKRWKKSEEIPPPSWTHPYLFYKTAKIIYSILPSQSKSYFLRMGICSSLWNPIQNNHAVISIRVACWPI